MKSFLLAVLLSVGCAGSSQASRASTLTSVHSSTMSLRAALLAYDSGQVSSILQTATTGADAKSKIAALHARETTVAKALDAADIAVATAITVNDDTSLKGAESAVQLAVTAVNNLLGGK